MRSALVDVKLALVPETPNAAVAVASVRIARAMSSALHAFAQVAAVPALKVAEARERPVGSKHRLARPLGDTRPGLAQRCIRFVDTAADVSVASSTGVRGAAAGAHSVAVGDGDAWRDVLDRVGRLAVPASKVAQADVDIGD